MLPEVAADHQGRTAHIIHLAGVAVGGFVGVAGAAVIPGAAITPNNAAGFLQAAIGEHQLGAHQAGIWPTLKGIEQFLEPAGAGFGVVVEQHHVGRPGGGHPTAAGLVKTPGKVVADHPNAGGFGGEGFGAAIAGAVVYHDHLKGHAGGGIGQGRQAPPGNRVLVVYRHHHAHLGIGCDG